MTRQVHSNIICAHCLNDDERLLEKIVTIQIDEKTNELVYLCSVCSKKFRIRVERNTL
jgi:transcription elongation factor Elf1